MGRRKQRPLLSSGALFRCKMTRQADRAQVLVVLSSDCNTLVHLTSHWHSFSMHFLISFCREVKIQFIEMLGCRVVARPARLVNGHKAGRGLIAVPMIDWTHSLVMLYDNIGRSR